MKLSSPIVIIIFSVFLVATTADPDVCRQEDLQLKSCWSNSGDDVDVGSCQGCLNTVERLFESVGGGTDTCASVSTNVCDILDDADRCPCPVGCEALWVTYVDCLFAVFAPSLNCGTLDCDPDSQVCSGFLGCLIGGFLGAIGGVIGAFLGIFGL